MSQHRSLAACVEHVEAQAWAQLQLALPASVKEELQVQVCHRGNAVWLATPGADVAAVNRVMGLGFDQPLTANELRSIQDWFTDACVRRWHIEWSPEARPADAEQLFAHAGAARKPPTVKLCRALVTEPETDVPPQAFTVREIGVEDAARFDATVAGPLGVPDQSAPGIRSTIGHAGWHFYLAFEGDDPIAGATMFVLGEGAWFGLAATAPRARRRGAQTALLNRRLRDAYRLGCRWVSADTQPETAASPNPSLRNMGRVGFEILYYRPKYLFDDSGSPRAARPSA